MAALAVAVVAVVAVAAAVEIAVAEVAAAVAVAAAAEVEVLNGVDVAVADCITTNRMRPDEVILLERTCAFKTHAPEKT